MEKSGGHWLRRAPPPGSVSELVHEFWQSSFVMNNWLKNGSNAKELWGW